MGVYFAQLLIWPMLAIARRLMGNPKAVVLEAQPEISQKYLVL